MNSQRLAAFLRANAVAIVLAVIPPLVIWYFTQRDSRGLRVTIAADIPIVTIDRAFADGIDVRYRGTQITALRAIEVSVQNSGNRPIARADFDLPLAFGFSGQALGEATIVRRRPPQLPVELRLTGPGSLQLVPLLLNEGDEFVFRVLVANADKASPVTVAGRILGVTDVQLRRATSDEDKSPFIRWSEIILMVVAFGISGSAVLRVLRNGYDIRLATTGTDVAVEFVKRLAASPVEERRVESLANDLGIAQHDFKSNVLLLRLKIENQLRDMARLAGLSDREQIGSMQMIARALTQRGILSEDIARLIAAIARPMNRELHELNSYLSDAEFRALQTTALDIVASLNDIRSAKQIAPNAALT